MARLSPMTLTPLLAFGVMSVAFVIGAWGGEKPEKPGMMDRALPEFALLPLAGTEMGFASADLHGQVALINVFAAWCSACRQEHPKLMELSSSSPVPIYGVNWKDAKGAGKLMLTRAGNPYVATGEDSEGVLGAELNVTGVPETYIVDAKGRLRYRHLGPITDKIWADILLPMITDLEAES